MSKGYHISYSNECLENATAFRLGVRAAHRRLGLNVP